MRVFVLTGAGVSAESGLGTFRDKGGIWDEFDPMELATPEAFARDPERVHAFYNLRRRNLLGAKPNAAHAALARLAAGAEVFLCTQNIDDLHEQAGSPEVHHMHGELLFARCGWCGRREACRGDLSVATVCEGCWREGGMRPDVVWFGEALPRDQLERAVDAARGCDVFFSIGTSGVVQPAASLAYAAHNRGAVVVEINAESTPLTPKVNYALQGRSGEILPRLVEVVWR